MTIGYVDGHYSLDIPFKKHPPDLPDNLPMAKQRLEGLRRRLSRDESLHVAYSASMNDLLSKSYAAVPESKVNGNDGLYLVFAAPPSV